MASARAGSRNLLCCLLYIHHYILLGEALEMAAEQTQQGEVLESTEEQGADSADITEVSRFMTAGGEIEAKASPREDAETVIRYQSGDKIYVTGELADGWCRVRYQDLTGY